MYTIKCKYEYSDGEVREWPVTWAVIKRMAGATYLCIEGRGSAFEVVVVDEDWHANAYQQVVFFDGEIHSGLELDFEAVVDAFGQMDVLGADGRGVVPGVVEIFDVEVELVVLVTGNL